MLKNRKILVAEDNALNQLIARKILEKWEVQFVIVENGKLAVDRIEQEAFDIVLMDIQMPVMDGYEASRSIRNLHVEYAKKIPIIALTASVTEELQDLVFAAGMNGFILKPYSPESLREAIIKFIA